MGLLVRARVLNNRRVIWLSERRGGMRIDSIPAAVEILPYFGFGDEVCKLMVGMNKRTKDAWDSGRMGDFVKKRKIVF